MYSEIPNDFFENSDFEKIIPERFDNNSIDSKPSFSGGINSTNISNAIIKSMKSNNEHLNVRERAEKIMNKINTQNLTEYQITELFKIFIEFGDAFYIMTNNFSRKT